MINNQEELRQTANQLAARGKGLLAVDESTPTIGKRLAGINIENTEENRQAYRGMLFTAEGIGEYISGIILFEETLYQNHLDGETMVSKINKLGIIPGIKVDKGLSPEVETWCKGLEGLAERTAEYYKQGARFAKWRAVLQITADGCPTDLAIKENAWGLARYAKICQESGLVPIIEPEILMDGDHTIEKTAEVQEKVLVEVYKACSENNVFLEGTLLKPSMTVSGADNSNKAGSEEVAKMTVRTMNRCVPAAVPGIMFLSGGLTEEDASVYLNTMNSIEHKSATSLTFSYGRALQQSCLQAWKGKALMARCQANSESSTGDYVAGSQSSSQDTLFEAGYKY